ncbi:MAG TPA: UDP-N-acetylmuramoyl-L-alanyl-D-glutamate--2,6-diaminopimelate ligase [Acidimicrobiales bacterium]|nr:UDP-N-acetylmuramoyl-L-alanyl-D-glutamate--2,6-diaminopimelate ligase [Acidimicrobiales bacterium]
MKLSNLLEGAGFLNESHSSDPEISRVVHDSRSVQQGDLFCCVPGLVHDGHEFVLDAIKAGAAAVLSERFLDVGVPLIETTSARKSLALLSSFRAGNPSRDLEVVGVTGTNGKTSVIYLLEQILSRAGQAVESSGTLTGERTTPEAPDLQNRLALWRDNGIDSVVMEVSSHALSQHRVDGTEFSAVAFTNLSRDHLDYHKSMEEYFKSKERLFDSSFTSKAVVVVGQESGDRIADISRKNGLEVVEIDATNISPKRPWNSHSLEIPFEAEFMIINTLVAAELAVLLDVPSSEIAESVRELQAVPGRFEILKTESIPTVIIDYAHTPEALKATLASARGLKEKGKLFVVFGCGGGRDQGKRPLMGAIADVGADFSVVTSDNPRGETPMSIINEVVRGMSARNHIVEEDRKEAIKIALKNSKPEDIVVIAGKGHESTQEIAGELFNFEDREVAKSLIFELFEEEV